MPNLLLKHLADLGQFQHAPSLNEPNEHHPHRHWQHVGFIVAITTRRSSGFLTAPEEKDPSLGERKDAWIFPSRAAVKVALARALGLNLSRCRVDVLPSFVLGTGEAA